MKVMMKKEGKKKTRERKIRDCRKEMKKEMVVCLNMSQLIDLWEN